MKIRPDRKVNEVAGEHVVLIPGRYGADMTRVIAFSESSLYLWEALQGRTFETSDVVALLCERYEIDAEVAERDAAAWVEKLLACDLLEA